VNIINTAKMAHVLKMPARTLNHHVLNDGCPRVDKNQFDLVPVVHWYIGFLEQKADRVLHDETLTEAQRRQTAARAKLSELEYAKQRSEVMLISEHKRLVQELILPAKAKLLGLPSKVAPQVAHMDEAGVFEALSVEVTDMLTDLARGPQSEAVEAKKKPAPAKARRRHKTRRKG
jgi:phage terminase Nu1 subunit (DNA packaging protein)